MDNVVNADYKKKSPFKFVWPFLLLLVAGIIGFGVYEYLRIAPRDVRFTNVTSSSVTVSWNTKSPTSASALVFEGDTWLPLTLFGVGGERFYDTRDVKAAELRAVEETATNIFNDDELGISMEDISTEVEVVNMGEYYTHHVSISGLNPESVHSFMIGDGYLHRKVKDVVGIGVVETLAVPNSVEAPTPAYGSIKDAQGSQDPGMLEPVSDGIVYFNLMDEITGNRSTVYSGVLNENGNWYIDISGIRVVDGEDFLSGEVIANVVGEIRIDAGPSGEWEGDLSGDVIAPAEMIVINDPLQMQIDGVGIKKVESNVLGDFTFDTEAAGCAFAGYCGPCYDGVLTNPCSCPQDILNTRPGCKGQEDGTTIEQAISKVASAGSGCSGGAPSQYVYSYGECKQCLKYIVDGVDKGYRWQKASDQAKCDTNKTGAAFGSGGTQIQETSCSPSTPLSSLKVGVKCCSSGKWGVGSKLPAERCPDGDCTTVPLYCDLTGGTAATTTTTTTTTTNPTEGQVGAPCDLPNGTGVWMRRDGEMKCYATSCDEDGGYTRKWDSGQDIFTCVREGAEGGRYTVYMPLITFGTNVSEGETEVANPVGGGEKGTEIGVAAKCSPDQAPCFCSTADYIGPNGFCPETASCVNMGQATAGRICSTSGARCVGEVCAEKAEKINPIGPGEKCETPPCGCPLLSYDLTNPGTYCPQTYNCTYSQSTPPDQVDGKICNPSGNTCSNGSCSGSSVNLKEGFFGKIVAQSRAQETNSFIVDGGLNILEELPVGTYMFEHRGDYYRFWVPEGADVGLIYIDENDNDIYDEGIDVLVSDIASQISVQTVERTYNYSFVRGMNFISFPHLISNPNLRTAAGLLQELNKQYPDSVFSISRFEGGRWKIVGENVELYDINDFQLLPGQGYVLKAREDFELNLLGQPVKYESAGDNAPVALFEGWNLVGLYGTGVKTYTAKSMLVDINASDFTANNVSKWEKEKQIYEGFQSSEGQDYGFDFPINSLESVFVRVLEGRGNWQPKLKGQ